MGAKRRLLYEESVPIRALADRLDLEWLRRQFAEPFDRAAMAVQRAGFEQDDSIVERIVVCQFPGGGEPKAIVAEWLSDRSRMQQLLLDHALRETGGDVDLEGITIVGIKVEAYLEGQP